MTDPKQPGLIEKAAGWVALKALLLGSRRADKRGDLHEFQHIAAAVVAGNSNHATHPCPISPGGRIAFTFAELRRLGVSDGD